jgi:hypothetical protein
MQKLEDNLFRSKSNLEHHVNLAQWWEVRSLKLIFKLDAGNEQTMVWSNAARKTVSINPINTIKIRFLGIITSSLLLSPVRTACFFFSPFLPPPFSKSVIGVASTSFVGISAAFVSWVICSSCLFVLYK